MRYLTVCAVFSFALLQAVLLGIYFSRGSNPGPIIPRFIRDHSKESILEIAHRGYSAAAPENTLAALREAKRRGVGVVECDLQVSQDDILVVAHDFKLDNFTNSTGMIIEKNWNELEWLQVTRGGNGRNFSSAESRLIDFETLATEAKLLDLDLIVELRIAREKTDKVIESFLKIVQKHSLQDRIVMQTFFPNIIWKTKSLSPEVFTMQLFLPKPVTKFCQLRVHGQSWLWSLLCSAAPVIDAIAEELVIPISSIIGADSIGMAFPLLTPERVAALEQAGFIPVAWTVNTVEEKKVVTSNGIKILMSDCPQESCPSVLHNYIPKTE